MRALLALGGLLGALLLAGFAGSLWWGFDVVSDVRPQLAVVGLGVALLLLVGGRKRSGTLLMVTSAVAAVTVAWIWVPPADEPTGRPVRVVTFNLLSSNAEYEAVIDWLRQVDADVVFLQEASLPWEEALAEAGLGYRVEVARDPELIFGTVVLTDDPQAQVTGYGFATGQPRAVEVRLPGHGGFPLTLLGIHPLSPTSEERSSLRSAQIDWALERLRDVGAPVVLAGDFNAGPWSAPFRRLLGAGLVDSQRGVGLQPSFPARAPGFLRVAIDHVLVSDGVSVADRRLGPPLGSDHLPVVVDLLVE